MRRLWLILFGCFFIACKSNTTIHAQLPPYKTDVEEIVKIIVSQDSLNRADAPLSGDLTKINLAFKDCDTVSPIGHETMNINRLLREQVGTNYFFVKHDSSYLISQNDIIKSFNLDTSFSRMIKLTNNQAVRKQRNYHQFARYYELTLPLFSLDGKRAWVELNYCCPLCGYGLTIFLEKRNGKWTILHQRQEWVS